MLNDCLFICVFYWILGCGWLGVGMFVVIISGCIIVSVWLKVRIVVFWCFIFEMLVGWVCRLGIWYRLVLMLVLLFCWWILLMIWCLVWFLCFMVGVMIDLVLVRLLFLCMLVLVLMMWLVMSRLICWLVFLYWMVSW